MNRAQQLLGQYRVAGEELYNQAVRGKMPEASYAAMEEYAQEVPCTTWNTMDTRMRSSDPAMLMVRCVRVRGEAPLQQRCSSRGSPSVHLDTKS